MKRAFTVAAAVLFAALLLTNVAAARGGHGRGGGWGDGQHNTRGGQARPAPQPNTQPASQPIPTPTAQPQQGDIELSGFSGDLRISGRGTVIATLASGTVQLTVSSTGQVSLAGTGCPTHSLRGGSYTCRGANIRVSALGVAYTVSISGANMNASVVGSGSASVRGTGSLRLNGTSQPLPARGYLNFKF